MQVTCHSNVTVNSGSCFFSVLSQQSSRLPGPCVNGHPPESFSGSDFDEAMKVWLGLRPAKKMHYYHIALYAAISTRFLLSIVYVYIKVQLQLSASRTSLYLSLQPSNINVQTRQPGLTVSSHLPEMFIPSPCTERIQVMTSIMVLQHDADSSLKK